MLQQKANIFRKTKCPNTFRTYYRRTMSRQKVTLRLNADVVKRAKDVGINISGFLEVKLIEFLALMNGTPRGRFELPRGQVPTSSPGSRRSGLGHLGINQIQGISLLFKTFSRQKDKFPYSLRLSQYLHIIPYLSGLPLPQT